MEKGGNLGVVQAGGQWAKIKGPEKEVGMR
jgi:hypothetical protein